MWIRPRCYEADIRLYIDKEKKVLFKFIHWRTWAWGLQMAKFFAHLEGRAQIRKYFAAKTYAVEVNKL